jgi:hypothetical protein
LQLLGDLLDGEGGDNLIAEGGEEGMHGIRAVFLVLFEAATEAIYPQVIDVSLI